MKYLLILVGMFPVLLFGQSNILLNKIWIGERLEYLEIRNDSLILDDRYGPHLYGFKIFSDTFNVFSWEIKDNPEKINLYSAKFKIQHISEDSMSLIPLNYRFTKNYFKDTTILKFVNEKLLVDTNLILQRINFTSTGCYGDCPEYKMIIDSNGLFYLEVGRSKALRKGFYKGKLSSKQLENLIYILKRSELDRFPDRLYGAVDAPVYSFIFSYNNKIRKATGSFIPYFDYKLKYFLLDLPSKVKLKKTNTRIQFD